MILKILSSSGYDDTTRNYGDCLILVDDKTAVVYDCGSEEHAKRVVKCLDAHGIDKATVILSHNDSDHFNGIPYLIKEKRVDKLFTVLLLKYKDVLLDQIDDGRRNLHSIGEAIKELYDNIASLSGQVKLRDVYENTSELPKQLSFVGPTFDYMIQAAAKGLDNREGDSIDGETITNAASVQIQIKFGEKKVLLTGDCAASAIPDTEKLNTYSYIQLPHHGKATHAEDIFERGYPNNDIVYVVSDNTGNTNGGSKDLNEKGHQVKNTKKVGDIEFSSDTAASTYIPNRTLGL